MVLDSVFFGGDGEDCYDQGVHELRVDEELARGESVNFENTLEE